MRRWQRMGIAGALALAALLLRPRRAGEPDTALETGAPGAPWNQDDDRAQVESQSHLQLQVQPDASNGRTTEQTMLDLDDE